MKPLFRRIREKLIGEGKVWRYLIYAVGEIMLVVIGILIALQVNNWNENRINKAMEYEYLKGLHSDLDRQIEILETKNRVSDEAISIVYELLEEYLRLDGFGTSDSTLIKIHQISRANGLSAVKTTFSELTYGAGISLIRDEKLRNDIVLFYQNLEDEVDNSNNNSEVIFQTQIYPIFFKRTIIVMQRNNIMNVNLPPLSSTYSARTKNLAFDNLQDPDEELEFVNALNTKAIIEGLQRERSKQIIASAEQLKLLIEEEVRDEHNAEL